MIKIIFTGLVVIVVLVTRFFKSKGSRRDYSLGLEKAKKVHDLIKNQKYAEVETVFSMSDANTVTHLIDHLALSHKKEIIIKWNETRPSDLSKVVLGVFYLHQAWIERGHSYASDVSDKQAEAYFDNLNLSQTNFDKIEKSSPYYTEVCSRSIRLYMSFGDYDLADDYYNIATSRDKDLVYTYLHYAECIQPKWGGNMDKVSHFFEELPKGNFLIKSIVELQLISSGISQKQNFFSKYNTSVEEYGKLQLDKIDKEISNKNIDSIHRYILYNYMDLTASYLKNKTLEKKYNKLADDKDTLYPYGVIG